MKSELPKRTSKPDREAVSSVVCLYIRITVGLICFVTRAEAQAPAEFFEENCSICHTIGGGDLVGPDLKDVTQKKERDWLIRFMLDPEGVINSGDPYAADLVEKADGIVMPPNDGLTEEIAGELLDYIEGQSGAAAELPAEGGEAAQEKREIDPILGDKYFTGRVTLKNGAPPCLACHGGLGPDIGGSLGPDLSLVFNKLQGRNALTSWLKNPPTRTMKSVFGKHPLDDREIDSLVDLFEAWTGLDRKFNDAPFIIIMSVIFYGFGGAALGLLIFGGFWSFRFSAVRRPLIENLGKRGQR